MTSDLRNPPTPAAPQVALVRWTDSVGLTLVSRDLTSMQLKTPAGHILTFHILQIFPFTSESKRMGIIVRVRLMFQRVFNQNLGGSLGDAGGWM